MENNLSPPEPMMIVVLKHGNLAQILATFPVARVLIVDLYRSSPFDFRYSELMAAHQAFRNGQVTQIYPKVSEAEDVV